MEKQQTGDLSRMGKSLQAYNKNMWVPTPGHLLPTTRMETLAKVFRVNFPEIDENRAFSANDCCLSPDPDFSSLPNFHPLIERSSAEDV